MPPVSRFGGGARTKKKQAVIDKLKVFFEKYFGIGASALRLFGILLMRILRPAGRPVIDMQYHL